MKAQAQKTKIVRQLRSGQVTIPVEFRRALGIEEKGMLQMTLADGELRIKPLHVREAGTGSPWLKALYDYFAPVREEAIAKGYTEEEINAAIDEAVRASRADQ
ncbi:MAG: AbrB/MazE/SpoVT family DNA-binding domain-containing protein [Thermomicrobiales bacterium]